MANQENPNDDFKMTQERVKTAHLGYEGEITICVSDYNAFDSVDSHQDLGSLLFCFGIITNSRLREGEGGGLSFI